MTSSGSLVFRGALVLVKDYKTGVSEQTRFGAFRQVLELFFVLLQLVIVLVFMVLLVRLSTRAERGCRL